MKAQKMVGRGDENRPPCGGNQAPVRPPRGIKPGTAPPAPASSSLPPPSGDSEAVAAPQAGTRHWSRPASARSSDIEALLARAGASQQIVQLDLCSCCLSSLSHYRLAHLRLLRHLDISQNLLTSLRPVRALPAHILKSAPYSDIYMVFLIGN